MVKITITDGHGRTRTFESIDQNNPPPEGTPIFSVGRGEKRGLAIETTPKPKLLVFMESLAKRIGRRSTER